MNSEKLKLYIRKIVREEIPTILREHLRDGLLEILTENNQPSIKTVNSKITHKNTIREHVVEVSNKPYVKYTNNEMLNEVLNNTTGGVPQDGSMVGTMEGYDVQYSSNMNSAPKPVQKVNSVINQDFRSRMEAINRVKQNKMKEVS